MNRAVSLAIVLALCIAAPVAADIIPPDMKPIAVIAVIENCSDFPEYTFVKVETLGEEVRLQAIVGQDGRITKGYKFNRLHLLAVPREQLASAGEPDGAALLADPTLAAYDGKLEAGQELVSLASPVRSRTVYYRILAVKDGVIQLEKVRETTQE